MLTDYNLEDALEDYVDYRLSQMYVAVPCRVVSVRVSLEDQRVDVQPLINRVLPDETSKEQPVILNVPVIFPASKKAAMTFPVDVGDVVMCVFSQRSLDRFKASTGSSTYTPDNFRQFSNKDAVAIPGIFPFADSINDPSKRKWPHSTRDTVLVHNIGSEQECEFRLKENGNIEIKTDQDFYATFNDGHIECNNLTIDAQGSLVVNAGNEITTTSQSDTTISSSSNVTINASGDMDINAATWNVSIAGTAAINVPTTNWTGILNLAGSLAMSGGGGGGTATIDAPLTINNSVTVNGGDVVADGISLKTHVHPENGTGGGITGPAQ